MRFGYVICRIDLCNSLKSCGEFLKLSILYLIVIFGGLELEIWMNQCDCSCGLADLVRWCYYEESMHTYIIGKGSERSGCVATTLTFYF